MPGVLFSFFCKQDRYDSSGVERNGVILRGDWPPVRPGKDAHVHAGAQPIFAIKIFPPVIDDDFFRSSVPHL